MANKTIDFPKKKGVKKELKALKEEVVALIVRRYELYCFDVVSYTEVYNQRIAKHDLEKYKELARYVLLRDRLAFLQEKQAVGEPFSREEIDTYESPEALNFREDYERRLKEYQESLHKESKLEQEELEEMKELFSFVIYRFHPRLNPNTSFDGQMLFQEAAEEFEDMDLKALRKTKAEAERIKWTEENSVVELLKLLNRLKEFKAYLLEDIKGYKPYLSSLEEVLNDSEKLRDEIEGIKIQIETYREGADYLEEKIEEELKNID